MDDFDILDINSLSRSSSDLDTSNRFKPSMMNGRPFGFASRTQARMPSEPADLGQWKDMTDAELNQMTVAGRMGGIGRVIGGKEAVQHSWPWQLFLAFDEWDCGGVFIHPAWALTAAHCIPGTSWSARSADLLAAMEALGRADLTELTEEDFEQIGFTRAQAESLEDESNPDNFYQVRVIFGLHDMRASASAKVATLNQNYITVHPQFHSPTPYNNDIAIVKLKVPMRMTNYLSPVCLPSPDTCMPTGHMCAVTGWGNANRIDSDGDRFPDTLQEAAIGILDRGFCANPDPLTTSIKNKYYE